LEVRLGLFEQLRFSECFGANELCGYERYRALRVAVYNLYIDLSCLCLRKICNRYAHMHESERQLGSKRDLVAYPCKACIG
jgi:hypothetical protein